MRTQKKLPSLVTIAILTVITVTFWTGLEVYRALTIKPTPNVPANILAPVNPNLDAGALNKLQNRIDVPDSEIKTVIVEPQSQTPVPTIAPTAAPEATSEAQTPLP